MRPLCVTLLNPVLMLRCLTILVAATLVFALKVRGEVYSFEQNHFLLQELRNSTSLTENQKAFVENGISKKIIFYRSQSSKILKNLKKNKVIIEHLAQTKLPFSILSIALVESHFKNHKPKGLGKPAGIWMFMPQTAKAQGLRVGKTDDRLHITKSTKAFARMLQKFYRKHNNWVDAVLAYHAGEGRFEEFKQSNFSVKKKKRIRLPDPDYLEKILAAEVVLLSLLSSVEN